MSEELRSILRSGYCMHGHKTLNFGRLCIQRKSGQGGLVRNWRRLFTTSRWSIMSTRLGRRIPGIGVRVIRPTDTLAHKHIYPPSCSRILDHAYQLSFFLFLSFIISLSTQLYESASFLIVGFAMAFKIYNLQFAEKEVPLISRKWKLWTTGMVLQ